MNYVDSGTFWVIVVAIVIAIYAAWSKPKKETSSTEEKQELNRTLADLYNGLADIQQVLEVLEDGANKATQDKLKEIHKKRGDK